MHSSDIEILMFTYWKDLYCCLLTPRSSREFKQEFNYIYGCWLILCFFQKGSYRTLSNWHPLAILAYGALIDVYIYVHAYLYIDETNLHCYTEFKHEFKDEFTSICCRRGTSGLGLCALENAISSGKQGDRQVWASTYMLLVDRTWKEEKARKWWSNACACYTLQGSSAKLGAMEEVYSCPSSTYNLCFLEVLLELEYLFNY